VRAAQERVKAEKARREQRKRQLQEDDAAAHAGYDSDGGVEWQDEDGGADADDTEMQDADNPAAAHGGPAQRAGGLLGRQPGLQMEVEIVDWPEQFMQAKLHCRLVVLPNADGQAQSQQHPQDTNDVSVCVCWGRGDCERVAVFRVGACGWTDCGLIIYVYRALCGLVRIDQIAKAARGQSTPCILTSSR
jgi:hypothetical protein